MTSNQVYEVSQILVSLVASVMGVTVVPYVYKKIGLTNIERYKSWAIIGAEAAEKMYQKYTGDDKSSLKKDYVVKFLVKIFKGKLTEDQITALIESAALKVDNSVKDIQK